MSSGRSRAPVDPGSHTVRPVVVIVGPRPRGCWGDCAWNWTIKMSVLMPVTRLDENLQRKSEIQMFSEKLPCSEIMFVQRSGDLDLHQQTSSTKRSNPSCPIRFMNKQTQVLQTTGLFNWENMILLLKSQTCNNYRAIQRVCNFIVKQLYCKVANSLNSPVISYCSLC